MSIVPLKKVSMFGTVQEKTNVLEQLQALGCMHTIPQKKAPEFSEKLEGVSAEEIKRALSHLQKAGNKRHQVLDEPKDFDLKEVIREIIENRNKIRDTEDDIYYLKNRVKEIEPWGNFILPAADQLAGYRLWFYRVPHGKVKNIGKIDIPYCSVAADQRYQYIVLISEEEPPAEAMPVTRSRTARRSLDKLNRDLQSARLLKEDLTAEHDSLSRWHYLLSNKLARAQDEAVLKKESEQVREEGEVLLVQGWVSVNEFDLLESFAKFHKLALLSEDPKDEEKPPTIMDNPLPLEAGEGLVTFYKTPAYGSWDPSIVVFFSFSIFFAMILADAGYALLLLLAVGYFWRGWGKTAKGAKTRYLALAITLVSVVYGVLLGSYFGVAPPENTFLSRLKVFEINDYEAMMKVSVVVGCLHLTVANIAVFKQAKSFLTGLPSIGWISIIFGGLGLFFADTLGAAVKDLGNGLIMAGFLLILFFSSERNVSSIKGFALRVFDGLISLANISKLFGDAMSYLRLFALGLASSALAVTFNQAASSFYHSSPVFGPALAILVLIVGHLINLVLSVVSCFVHGLRLNVIEFFNWGLSEDGYPFQAFRKKENN